MAFLYGASVFSQPTIAGPKNYLMPNSTITDLYIPPDPDIFAAHKVQTADIVISSYDVSTTGHIPFPQEAKDALDYALMIWANTITSSVQIRVRAGFAPFATAYPQYGIAFAVGAAESWTPNFSSADPKFVADTWYPYALASKMHGSDISPTKDDIVIVFNSKYHTESTFYYPTDGQTPDDKWDFVSVCLHELCHGLGFAASARDNGTTYQYNAGTQDFPLTYDRLLVNNSGTALTSFSSSAAGLQGFLTSNNLFFNGSDAVAANGGNVKIFAPTVWNQGGKGSIGHLDEVTFNVPPAYTNALMSPGLDKSIAIHNPGPVGIGIMNDIGWDAELYIVGIYDRVEIYDGDLVFPYLEPVTELNVGGNYDYQMIFIDENDPNWIRSREWKLVVLHKNGRYTLQSLSNNSFWNFTLLDLPIGYEWLRNIHGQVRAVITAKTTDNNWYDNQVELPVTINYKPDKPEISLRNNPNGSRLARWGCSSVQVSFHAKGATSYLVHYKKTTDPWFLTVSVPSGSSSYTFTRLDESKDYNFQMEAINNGGGTLSDVVTRKSCTATLLPASQIPFLNQQIGFINEIVSIPLITAFPNPCIFSVQFNISSTVGARIQRIELINTSNSAFSKTVNANPPVQQVLVDMYSLPAGLYSAKVTDTNNYEVTLLVLKIF